ncbi:MAG: coproporphyrinogen-III oxidase family protein, partial [Spirochaetia bacterium]
MARPDPGLSLYIHVPFCTDKCLYCDFYSVPCRTVSDQVLAAVIDQTIGQARFFLDAAAHGRRVETLFIGGGTPSVLPRKELEKLFSSLSDLGCAEWTVEANPETLDDSFLSLCRDAGVTRLSVGIQTLQEKHLRLLRRRASKEDALSAIRRLGQGWQGEVNLDFIAGIPGQTVQEVRDDLSVLEGSWPSHVSLYQLTVEPDTRLAALVNSGEIALNTPDQDEALWFAGKGALENRGYQQYEVSNFCLPGRECRHNLRYWRIDPYAGAGPAAASTLPGSWIMPVLKDRGAADLSSPVFRLSNPKDIHAFLQGPEALWGMEIESIAPRDFLLENLMMGLRMARGIPSDQL